MILIRILHIVLGVIWVGAIVFTTFFLAPAIRDVGPEGGKVMVALQRRHFFTIMPIVALVTLLSGVWLYWRASVGFETDYMRSPSGVAFGTGGVLATLAFIVGVAVMRPAMTRVMSLSQSMHELTDDQQRQHRMGEIVRLRERGTRAARLTSLLLIAATAAMAIARYL